MRMTHTLSSLLRCEQLAAIETEATQNHLKLNAGKSREMVFTWLSWVGALGGFHGWGGIDSMVVLRVAISSDLRTSSHVSSVLGFCSSSIYALSVLIIIHGPAANHTVARATTTACPLYAAPTWWGLTTAEDR